MNERLTGEEQLGKREITRLVAIGLLGKGESATQIPDPNGNRLVKLGGNRHVVQPAGEPLDASSIVIPWCGL